MKTTILCLFFLFLHSIVKSESAGEIPGITANRSVDAIPVLHLAGVTNNVIILKEDKLGLIASIPESYAAWQSVEMTKFIGFVKGKKVLLQWQTASEQDNQGFEVQRLNYEREWEPIGYVEGNGTTFLLSNYSLMDKTPLEGMPFYRLMLIDFSGNRTPTKPINITYESTNGRKNSPSHPTVRDSRLYYQTVNGGIAILSIIGPKGEAILNRRIALVKGWGSIPIGLNDLPDGVYELKLEHEEFNEQLLLMVE